MRGIFSFSKMQTYLIIVMKYEVFSPSKLYTSYKVSIQTNQKDGKLKGSHSTHISNGTKTYNGRMGEHNYFTEGHGT